MKAHIFSLIALITVFFLPFFINSSILTQKDNDLGRTYIPLYQDLKISVVKYHQMPIWNPRQMMGESQIASPLPAFFYPLNIIFLLFPTNFAAILYLYFHFILAAIATFLLAKNFKLSNTSSFCAALFYSMSTKFLLHLTAGHITMLAAFSYFPLLFLGVLKIISTRNPNWISFTALVASLMFFTHPTIFYYSLIFVVVYVIYLSLQSLLNQKSLLPVKKYFSIAAAIIITLLLSAIAIIPILEFNAFSNRSDLGLEDVAIPLWNLKRFVLSAIFPYPIFQNLDHESFLYLGTMPLVLFIAGFIKLPEFKKTALFTFGLITLFFVAGLSTPVFELAYKYLPFLKYSRVTTRPWFIVVLLASLVAAYGLENIKKKILIYILLSIFVIESCLIFSWRLKEIPNLKFNNQKLYEYLKNDKEIFRVYCASSCFNPQTVSSKELQILNGETPVQNANFVDFLEKVGNYQFNNFAVIFPPYQTWQVPNPPIPSSRLLGEANVKYVASNYEIQDKNLKFIEKFDEIYLYQNIDFKKRIYFENSQRNAKILKYTPNNISLSLEKSPIAQNLIFSENYYPGWVAVINGRKFPVQKQDPIFRKVVIPPNTSYLEIKYQPQSLNLGKTITIGTIFYLAMYFWYSRTRKNKWPK